MKGIVGAEQDEIAGVTKHPVELFEQIARFFDTAGFDDRAIDLVEKAFRFEILRVPPRGHRYPRCAQALWLAWRRHGWRLDFSGARRSPNSLASSLAKHGRL